MAVWFRLSVFLQKVFFSRFLKQGSEMLGHIFPTAYFSNKSPKGEAIAKETSCHPTARLLLKMGNEMPKVSAFGTGTRWLKEVSMWEKETLGEVNQLDILRQVGNTPSPFLKPVDSSVLHI